MAQEKSFFLTRVLQEICDTPKIHLLPKSRVYNDSTQQSPTKLVGLCLFVHLKACV